MRQAGYYIFLAVLAQGVLIGPMLAISHDATWADALSGSMWHEHKVVGQFEKLA